MECAVRFDHVTMEFPGVLANDDISLEIRRGEVFALVGENGAGKSTLMNLLYGIHTPTAGDIYIKGQRLEQHTSGEAIEKGVGMVHQHFMLVPSFTVAQNIVLSREPRKWKVFCDKKAAIDRALAISEEYGLAVDPTAIVGELSIGLQQRVEILKALYRGADILILDEPTAVLTPQETTELFAVIRRVVEEKAMTVILITHKLNEVKAISDRVGIMRKGRLVDVRDTASVTERELASLMVGRPILYETPEKTGTPGEVRLEVKNLSVYDNRGLTAVKNLSLSVREGEILGIAAIEGNGQSELLEAVTGLRPCAVGTVTLCGQEVTGRTPGEIRGMGLAHIPEDRLATGVSKEASVAENLLTGRQREKEFLGFAGYQRQSTIARYAESLFDTFDIRGAGIEVAAGSLSGGNLQKVVVARECSFDTPVLIISQPTRGVDVGAIEFIHKEIIQKRNEGKSILLSSADLDEVFRLSDRIITLYEGRITGEFTPDSIEKDELGYYMTGNRRKEGATDEVPTL